MCVAALTRVAVSEQGADGQQDLGDGEGGTPVVLQDVQTDHPLTVDVAVVDPGAERHLDDTHTTRGSKSLNRFILKLLTYSAVQFGDQHQDSKKQEGEQDSTTSTFTTTEKKNSKKKKKL